MRNSHPSARVALIALVTHLVLGLATIVSAGGDPAVLVRFTPPAEGRPASPGYDAATAERGTPPAVPGEFGHDGEQFWILSRDPLLLDDATGPLLDRPSYRAQRVLLPLVASVGGLAGADARYWWLFAVGLAAVAAGAWLTAELARELGASPMAGLVFAFCPPVLVSTMYTLSDTLALAALVAVALALRRGHWPAAIGAGVVAVLAKEPSLLSLLGASVLAPALVGDRLWRRILLTGVPLLVGGAWGLYAVARLGGAGRGTQEFEVVPLAGYVETLGRWTPAGFVSAAAVLVLALVVGVRWWRRRTLELAMCVPVAVLAPFLSHQVVFRQENSLRALGPVIVFLGVDLLAARRRSPSTSLEPAGP